MRKFFGTIFLLGGATLAFVFATSGRPAEGAEGPWWPFKLLGQRYPADVGYLLGAAWALGLGVYFVLTEGRRPEIPLRHMRLAAPPTPGPSGKIHLLNSLLLGSSLFAAYVGVRVAYGGPLVPALAVTAGLQVVFGLFLLLLALFDKPRSVPSLLLGTAVYAAGTAVAVTVVLMGRPV